MSEEDTSGQERPLSVRESMTVPGQPPTPVRRAVDSAQEAVELEEPPSTVITVDEEEWIVRVEGRATVSAGSATGAPVLLLTFSRASSPSEPVKELVCVGRRLDGFSHDELLALLERAGPHRKDWESGDLFTGTRKPRGGG